MKQCEQLQVMVPSLRQLNRRHLPCLANIVSRGTRCELVCRQKQPHAGQRDADVPLRQSQPRQAACGLCPLYPPQQAVPVRVELLISTMRTGVMCISRRELRPSGQCGQRAEMDAGEALATQAQTLMGENVSLANVEQASTGDTPAAPLRRTGHPGGDRQTARGQARLRLAAAPLGRRADLCLDWAQPPAEQGL
jgi:hypothetical protein